MFLAEPEVQDALRPRLAERFGSRIYVARTLRTFLEVMAAGVSKGRGLALALEHRGLAPGGVIALGDEENDLPLFDAAGFSVAPANAKDKVREAADRVVGSNAEDGVAVFLEEFFGENSGPVQE
jgi:hydroxymethylpyrimidine pyrophosphatase-like HAD family hydrolase